MCWSLPAFVVTVVTTVMPANSLEARHFHRCCLSCSSEQSCERATVSASPSPNAEMKLGDTLKVILLLLRGSSQHSKLRHMLEQPEVV